MTQVTKEQSDEYVKHGGAFCPICKSIKIEAGQSDFEGDTVYQNVTCWGCGAEWTDVFRLESAESVD